MNIVESVDQVRDRCLAGAGRADKCDLLSRFGEEFHVMEYDLVVVITKIYSVEYHIAPYFYIVCAAVRLVGMLPRPSSGSCSAFR